MSIVTRKIKSLGRLFPFAFPILFSGCNPDSNYLLFVGTYTGNGSEGIYSYRFNAQTADVSDGKLAAVTDNPSFIVADKGGRFLYAVNEIDMFNGEPAGSVSSFSINSATGDLTLLNRVSSLGSGPAHLSLDKTGRFLLVANYGGGNVSVFRLEADGRIGENTALIQHYGSGSDTKRQAGPHAHFIRTTNDNKFVLVADLGIDKIMIYKFDDKTGTLEPTVPGFIKTDPGAGPRRFAFSSSGDIMYVLNELNSTVAVFAFDRVNATAVLQQTISTLPENYSGSNTAAEIRVDDNGKFLYVSNRGDNSIAQFSIDKVTGQLSASGRTPTNGNAPRHFEIDPTGQWLLAANQRTDNVVLFHIDGKAVQLAETNMSIDLTSPVCVLFVKCD